MGLFHIQEDAAGSVFWHNKGWALYRIIENYIRGELFGNGYEEVRSPQLYQPRLWERSGHIGHYEDNIFKVGDDFILKPMNCPAHVQIFNQGSMSYRDLPRRIAEFGCCHRAEPSGSLHGIMRVRQFVQDDAHIFCAPEHIEQEIDSFCAMLKSIYARFGFNEVSVALSLRPVNRAGDDDLWDHSEDVLRKCLERFGAPFEVLEGEGAFYGPKLEFSLKDSQGRWWQCGTLQLDFILPHRLGARYLDRDNEYKEPVMIHRAVLGSLERFIGILLEHYGVDLPSWIAPTQVVIIPVSDAYVELAKDIGIKSGLRYEVSVRDSVGKRIREYQSVGVPAIVVGDKEKNGDLSIRQLDGSLVQIHLDDLRKHGFP